MMSRCMILIMLAAFVPHVMAAEKKEASPCEELKGVWKGQVENGATGHVLTFTAKLVDGQRKGKDLGGGEYQLDATGSPAAMDVKCTRGDDKGKTYRGIYRIEGDTLRWCVATPGKERPGKFATAGGNFLLVLKRQKD